jgi:hypothetical protein
MTALELLTAARARIKKGWCQETYARDANGASISVRDPSAVSFCLYGALLSLESPDHIFVEADAIIRSLGGGTGWNDAKGRTQEDVLRVYDRAIEIARKKEKP